MSDRELIRELARQYKELSALPVNAQRIELYKKSNGLMGVTPVVHIDEIPWGEMNLNDELTLTCKDSSLRGIESYLRTMIFKWKHLQGHMVLPDYYPVYHKLDSTDIGVSVKEHILDTAVSGSGIVAHEYLDQLPDEDALAALKLPQITLDKAATDKKYNFIGELFGDILAPRLTGTSIYSAIWDNIPRYHGVENMLMDLYDRPDFMHKMVSIFTDMAVSTIDQYEQLGVLEPYPLYIHCTPAPAYELPSADFDGKHVRKKDVWGRGMAQIFSTVSPATREEFDIDYAMRIYGDCGLVYYGCCEPLDNQIDVLRKFKNLRKISITPWADADRAADVIGKEYVFSYKPNPAFVAGKSFDPAPVREELSRVLAACKRNGTQCELILKDISTVGQNPMNLIEWERLAVSMAENF